MSTPGFAAEASLYKTRQVYRGFGPGLGRDAALNVVPQLSCSDTCWVYYGLCLLGSGGNPLAAAVRGHLSVWWRWRWRRWTAMLSTRYDMQMWRYLRTG